MKNSLSILFLLVFVVSLMACSTKKKAIELTDCYATKEIESVDFMDSDNSIKSNLDIKCDDGYIMTGITQTAEKNPSEFGQFIIVSEIHCCRPTIE